MKVNSKGKTINQKKKDETIDKLVETIPNDDKVNAKAILEFIVSDPFWNDNGEIEADSATVQGSNIVELIKHASSKTSEDTPVGILQFYHMLARKVPIELIPNDNGIQLMMRNRIPRQHHIGTGVDSIEDKPKTKKRKVHKTKKKEQKPWITIDEDMVF